MESKKEAPEELYSLNLTKLLFRILIVILGTVFNREMRYIMQMF
jgi:hypothetical protein